MEKSRQDDQSPRWRSRGYLPHFEGGVITQFLTFRLADALPAAKLAEWDEELRYLRDDERSAERRKRIERYLDRGFGRSWLRDVRIARVVEDALLQFDAERYSLHAWVVMPNHVHVLFTPGENHALAQILHTWKSFTASLANRILGRKGKFWQEEYFDRYIRDGRHFTRAVEYIETNPVKAGLCATKEEWRFGSAGWRAAPG